MLKTDSNLYCGPLSLQLRSLIRNGHADNGYSWFNGASTYYVHTARTAIHRACELLNVKSDDEVLAPSYNCGTEIDALLQSGALVKMYDIDRSGSINFDDLYSRVSPNTRIIYVTHYFGFGQPLDELRNFCDKKSIYLFEDCALSLFSSRGMKKLGTTGDISVFNFPKFLPIPDGGVLQINNASLDVPQWQRLSPNMELYSHELLALIKRQIIRTSASIPVIYPAIQSLLHKSYRHYDEEVAKNKTARADMPECYYYDQQLTNKNLSGIGARIVANTSVEEVVRKRRTNFEQYLTLIQNVPNIKPFFDQLPAGVNPLSFPVIVKHRQWVCDELNELSIGAIAWWSGYHRDMPWQEFPDACFLKDNVLALPVHQQLRPEHVEYISKKTIELVNWHA